MVKTVTTKFTAEEIWDRVSAAFDHSGKQVTVEWTTEDEDEVQKLLELAEGRLSKVKLSYQKAGIKVTLIS